MFNFRLYSFLKILLFLCILTFASCGYKPSINYAKNEIQGNVFVDFIIDLKDPRNSVLIKDAMNEILIHNFGTKLVFDKKEAQTILNVRMKSISMEELQYDKYGFNKLYKAKVTIAVMYQNRKKIKSFDVHGDYDFAIDTNSTITDTKRFEAIKNASSKALLELISKIAVESLKK